MEEKEKTVPAPQKTPSPLIEEEVEHQSDNLNNYDEYAGGSSSENKGNEEEEEEHEEEDQADKDPSPPRQFNVHRLEEEVDAWVQYEVKDRLEVLKSNAIYQASKNSKSQHQISKLTSLTRWKARQKRLTDKCPTQRRTLKLQCTKP